MNRSHGRRGNKGTRFEVRIGKKRKRSWRKKERRDNKERGVMGKRREREVKT